MEIKLHEHYEIVRACMRSLKRPRVAEQGASVFRSQYNTVIQSLDDRERTIMSELCSTRKLDQMYYEGALTLWMRVKCLYYWDCRDKQQICTCKPECKLKHHLLVALHLCMRYCGPTCIEYHNTTVLQGTETWTGLNKDVLFRAELEMCQALNWIFF